MRAVGLALVFLCATGFANTVRNGGGKAEKNILFAYSKIESYIGVCFQTEACQLNQRQYGILSKILNGMHDEKLNHEQIKFASEKQTPGFFNIGGEIKIAKTGSEPGGTIYINEDQLYSLNSQGFYEALSLERAVEVLIHEFGHHYGDYTCSELDVLSVKVSTVMQKLMFSTPVIPWSSNVSATIVNDKNSNPDVLLYVFDDILDISTALNSQLTCAGGMVANSSVGYNLYWVNYDKNGSYDISGFLAVNCPAVVINKKFSIHLESKNNEYKSGSLKIQIFD